MNINMLSVLLLFGFTEIISGYNSTMLRSSSSVNVSTVGLESNIGNTFSIVVTAAAFNNASLTSETTQGTNNVPTRQLSTLPLSTLMHVSSTLNMSVSGIVKRKEATTTTSSNPPNKSFSPTHISMSFPRTTSSTSLNRSFSPTHISNFLSKSFPPTTSSTSLSKSFPPTTSSTTLNKSFSPTPNTTKAPLKINVFFWDVKPGTLKRMFYGAFGVAIVSTVVLIVVCCCWRRKIKKINKLQKQAETLCNPYVNSPVVGFPSPLRLASFVNRPESPYDTPEPVGTTQQDELPYVTVVDRKESESDYDKVKGNGTANYETDNESRDEPLPSPAYTNDGMFEVDQYQSESHNYDRVKGNGTANYEADNESRDLPPPSPAYTNDGMFETDPYQALMPSDRVNENNENLYTSLITRSKNEGNEENEVNEENEATV